MSRLLAGPGEVNLRILGSRFPSWGATARAYPQFREIRQGLTHPRLERMNAGCENHVFATLPLRPAHQQPQLRQWRHAPPPCQTRPECCVPLQLHATGFFLEPSLLRDGPSPASGPLSLSFCSYPPLVLLLLCLVPFDYTPSDCQQLQRQRTHLHLSPCLRHARVSVASQHDDPAPYCQSNQTQTATRALRLSLPRRRSGTQGCSHVA